MDQTGRQTLESMSQALWYNRWTLKKFQKFLHGRILEVGCGIGNFTKELTSYGEVFAIDIEKGYIDKTKKLVGEKAQVGFGDVEQGRYFFKDKTFDNIVCLNVLEHIENERKALQNLYKLLKRGGVLILLVPSHPTLYGEIDRSIGHFRRYDKEKLIKQLTSVEFKVLEGRRINLLGGLGWWISGRILKDNIVREGRIKVFNLIAPLVLSFESIFEPPFGTSVLIIATK